MTEWQQVTLAGVCNKPQYGAIAKGSAQRSGPRFVRQTDIASGRIDWASVPFCDLPASDFAKYALCPGDLLISRLGNGVGNAATVHDANEAVFAGYLVRFQPRPTLAASDFVGYQLQSDAWRQHVSGFRSGAAQPTLNAQQMGEFPFALPPLPEQRAIARTLCALDDKIESNRRAIGLASKLIDTTAERVTSDLSTTPLGTLVTTSKVGSNPAKLDIDAVDHYSLPAFDAEALPERVSPETIMSNKTLVPHRAILLSRLNPRIERFWWVTPENGVPALASTEFSTLVNETDIGLAAAWLALRSPGFREVLPMRVTGTSGSHQRVRPEDLLAIDVPDTRKLVKPLLEQALSLLEYIEMARRQSAKLAALRDSLLPELLSGRIRVPVEVAA